MKFFLFDKYKNNKFQDKIDDLNPDISFGNYEIFSDENINIFSNPVIETFETPKNNTNKPYKQLNDLDSTILSKNLINLLPNKPFKINLQLKNTEKYLQDIEKEINTIKLLGFDKDNNKLVKLEGIKQQLTKEIKEYKFQYRNLGLIYELTYIFFDISDNFIKKLNLVKKLFKKYRVLKKFWIFK
ncbi:MAG: hypothetical protein V2B14_07360 [bacterium]